MLSNEEVIFRETLLLWSNTFGKDSESITYPSNLRYFILSVNNSYTFCLLFIRRIALTKFRKVYKWFDQLPLSGFEPLPLDTPHPLNSSLMGESSNEVDEPILMPNVLASPCISFSSPRTKQTSTSSNNNKSNKRSLEEDSDVSFN